LYRQQVPRILKLRGHEYRQGQVWCHQDRAGVRAVAGVFGRSSPRTCASRRRSEAVGPPAWSNPS
jgi:hypothetical protein